MSQISQFIFTGSGNIITVTGNIGGAVGADVVGNIDFIGGFGIEITGNPAGSALVADLSGTVATIYTTDAGNAIPALNTLTVAGGANINTSGAGATLTVNLDNAITLTTVNATTFDTNVAAAGLTLSGTTLGADGTDAAININITPKGAGVLATTEITLTTPLAIAYGGTNANAMANANGVNYYDGTRIVTTAVGNAGQILTSNGAGVAPTFQDPGTITYTRDAGAAVALVADNGYINTNVGLTTFTLPAAAALGTKIAIIGESAAGWTIAQNAGQNVQYGNTSTTVGVGGSLSSFNRYDTVDLVCRVENTTWSVVGSVGVLNVV